MAAFRLRDLPIELWRDKQLCNNEAFQNFLVGAHAISQIDFEYAINRFQFPTLAPKEVMGTEIYEQIEEPCGSQIIKVHFQEEDHSSNADIRPEPAWPGIVDYSVPFFLGLKRLFPDGEFQFFKAITKPVPGKVDADDVVFRIITKDAAGLKRVVYLGDYSDLRP